MKKEKIVFWNVDTQYDFMRNDKSFKGALPIKGAKKIEGNLKKLTKYALDNNIKIISTADWHTKDSKEFSEIPDYFETFPAHCLQHTKGASFVPATTAVSYIVEWGSKVNFDDATIKKEVVENEQHIVIHKDAFDVFKGNLYVDQILKIIKPTVAIVYGVATNVCVNYAILGLRKRKIKVYAVIDAMKELPGCDVNIVFKKWLNVGVVLVDTASVSAVVNYYMKV